MAWLSGWNRRKQLYLSSTNSTTQSNYQMRVVVNYGSGTDSYNAANNTDNIFCGGNCNTDFSDIRFTDSTGTQLYYYIESYTASSNAIIWVKVPSIPNGTNSANIYIYYNNPTPPSDGYNSGDNTFIFMDDFSYGNSGNSYSYANKWNFGSLQTYSSITESGNTLTESVSGAGGGGSNAGGSIYNRINIGNGVEFHFYIKSASSNSNWTRYSIDFGTSTRTEAYGTCGGAIVPNDGYTFYINPPTWNQLTLFRVDNGTKTQLGPTASLNPNLIYLKATYLAPNINIYYSTDNTNWTQLISTANAPSKSAGPLFLAEYSCGDRGGSIVYDYLFVRSFTLPEPIWSTISAEQNVNLTITSTPVTGAEIWLRHPSGSGSGSYIDQGIQTNNTLGIVPDSYDIKLTAGGYQDWFLLNQSFTAGQSYLVQATLSLLPGSLAIYSTPTNSSIYLDGSNTSSGTTSPGGTTLTNISVGSHSIRLSLSNYADWTGTVMVNTQVTTTIRAVFAGSAYITSTPTNSSIYLDNNPTSIANTPSTITNLTSSTNDGTQPTQSHTYILRLTGYTDTSGSFTATAGQTTNVPVIFPGSLYITSIPTGARIYIDEILQP